VLYPVFVNACEEFEGSGTKELFCKRRFPRAFGLIFLLCLGFIRDQAYARDRRSGMSARALGVGCGHLRKTSYSR